MTVIECMLGNSSSFMTLKIILEMFYSGENFGVLVGYIALVRETA